MTIYDSIRAAFAYNCPDAELLLHQTVREILTGTWTGSTKLEKISLCYAAADAGLAQRRKMINIEGLL